MVPPHSIREYDVTCDLFQIANKKVYEQGMKNIVGPLGRSRHFVGVAQHQPDVFHSSNIVRLWQTLSFLHVICKPQLDRVANVHILYVMLQAHAVSYRPRP